MDKRCKSWKRHSLCKLQFCLRCDRKENVNVCDKLGEGWARWECAWGDKDGKDNPPPQRDNPARCGARLKYQSRRLFFIPCLLCFIPNCEHQQTRSGMCLCGCCIRSLAMAHASWGDTPGQPQAPRELGTEPLIFTCTR